MATVLTCISCKNPMTFSDPKIIQGNYWEKEVRCIKCGALYAILVRIIQPSKEIR